MYSEFCCQYSLFIGLPEQIRQMMYLNNMMGDQRYRKENQKLTWPCTWSLELAPFITPHQIKQDRYDRLSRKQELVLFCDTILYVHIYYISEIFDNIKFTTICKLARLQFISDTKLIWKITQTLLILVLLYVAHTCGRRLAIFNHRVCIVQSLSPSTALILKLIVAVHAHDS